MKLSGKLTRFHLALLLWSCIGFASFASERDRDMETIWEAEISKKFWKSLELSVNEEFRTREFFNSIDRLATGIGATYNHPALKDLKVGFEYNFLNYFEKNRIEENRHRTSLQVQYKYSYAGFDFSLRTRFQSTFRDERRGDYTVNPKHLWRNRIGVAYKIYGTPYEPYVQFEVSNPIANPENRQVDRLRYRVGCEYRVNKKNALDLFWRMTQEINQKEPINIYAIGVGYKFKL